MGEARQRAAEGPGKLVAQLRKLADKQTTTLMEPEELNTIATVVEALHRANITGAAGLEKLAEQVALQNSRLDRMELLVRLSRTFLLSDIVHPHIAYLRIFLRRYVDAGDWPPIPWPGQHAPITNFLLSNGYLCEDGFIVKKEKPDGQ